jgi:hypothetical protein
MFVKPSDAKKRRFRRRIKAAASIAVALCAGTFLACQRGVQTIQNAIDASSEKDADGDSNSPTPVDASNSTAMVLVADAGKDAEARAKKLKDAAVDVNEHRKGMPVPDNLLE